MTTHANTRNRDHANRPSIMTASDRVKLRTNAHSQQTSYTLAQFMRHAACLLVVAAMYPLI